MMKKFLIWIVTFLTVSLVKAQNVSRYFVFQKDTINIRGIVYDDLGKPRTNVLLFLKGKTYPKPTKTNSQGKFEINEISINDTIKVSYFTENITITNNGSRYLEIYLPSNRTNFTYDTLEISSKRKHPKKPTPTIRIDDVVSFPNYLKIA